jgi:hypothetical protein
MRSSCCLSVRPGILPHFFVFYAVGVISKKAGD